MLISDWSSDVCSSDLADDQARRKALPRHFPTIVRRNIAAAHEMNDLQFIAVLHPNIRQCGPGHNLQISLNGHLFGYKAQLACKLRQRSEEHTSELQSLMRISYAVFCLKKKNTKKQQPSNARVKNPTQQT